MEYLKKNAKRLKLIPALIRNNKYNLEELKKSINKELKKLIPPQKVVSNRTLYRDIKVLKELGLSIKTKKEPDLSIKTKKEPDLSIETKKKRPLKNYYIIEGNINIDIDDLLTEEEAKMFPILMGLINTEKELRTVNWLKNELISQFNFSEVELNPEPYFVYAHADINFKEDMLMLTAQIIEYIKHKKAIWFNYINKYGEKELCNVAPLQVRYYDSRYYLLGTEIDGKSHKIGTILRPFSMDKIIGKVVNPMLDENDEDEEQEITFDYQDTYKKSKLEHLLKYCFGIMFPRPFKDERPKTFRFKFTKWAIGLLKNKKFHHSQKIVKDEKDYIIVEMTLWDTKEVEYFYDRFRDACELLN